jgi:molybdate-binding protein
LLLAELAAMLVLEDPVVHTVTTELPETLEIKVVAVMLVTQGLSAMAEQAVILARVAMAEQVAMAAGQHKIPTVHKHTVARHQIHLIQVLVIL